MAQVKFCHLGWYRHLVRPMDYLVTYLFAVVAIAQFTLLLLLLLLLMLADVAGVQEVRSSSLWVR